MRTRNRAARSILAVFAATTLPTAAALRAQGLAPYIDTLRARQLSLQYAVPSSPAFSLVDVGKSSILRPTAFHELSAAVSSFTSGGGGFALPRELGVEIAPWFVAQGQRLTVRDYQRHPIRYKLRISGAVKRGADTLGATSVAFGLRFSLIDHADPRLDSTFLDSLGKLTSVIVDLCSQVTGPPADPALPGVVKDCADPRGDVLAVTKVLAAMSSSTSPRVRDSVTVLLAGSSALAAARKRSLAVAYAAADSLKSNRLANSWNRASLDVAFAVSANTIDSLGRDPKFDVLAAWVSGAFPVGRWGQVVYGANGRNAQDSVSLPRRWSGGVGAGLYLGSNESKCYAELRSTWQRSTKTIAELVAGSELKLYAGVWAIGSVGWATDPLSNRGRLTSRFTLRSSLPHFTTAKPTAETKTP